MKFTLENNKNAGHRVTINIPKKIIDSTLLKEFSKINKKTHMNGFRKGKIPIKIIQQKYGNNIYYDVFNKLMQKFFFEFLNKEKINIIGNPKYYVDEKDKQNKDFTYSVTYEKYPNVQIKSINLIKTNQIHINWNNEDIKKNILENQNKINIWRKVNRSIKIYDRVTINYSIYDKYKKINKFSTKNIRFIVFKNYLLNELNNKIINHYVNDIIFIKIFFSSFHPEKELQNKNIIFKIKIIKIEEKDEEKIENNIKNIEFNELNWESIKNKIIKDVKQISQNYLKNNVIKQLIKLNPIKIPPILLQEEINVLYKKLTEDYITQKNNILDKKYHINLLIQARKRLSAKLIIEKIIDDYKIVIDEKKIKSMIKKISLTYKKPLEIINIYHKNANLKKIIRDLTLEKEVIKFLKNQIKIIKKYYTFSEMIYYNFNNIEKLFF